MRVVVLKETPEDPALRLAWNDLVLRMERPEVFYTYEWALAASRAFHDTLQPVLFLLYDCDELRGVASFAVDAHRPEDALFLAASTADYCEILTAPTHRSAVFSALFTEMKQRAFRTLTLANLPSGTSQFDQLTQSARRCGFYSAWRPAYECAVIELGDVAQRQALVQELARKERYRRRLKKLLQLGAVEIAHSNDRLTGSQVEAIIAAQVARFLASDRVSPLVREDRRTFLHTLAELLTKAGWLKISALQVGGKPIAWNFGFVYDGSWFWYLPTFSVEYQHASPGTCLLHKLVEEACSDMSLKRLDLGLGEESYKVQFANTVQRTCYMQLSLSRRQQLSHKSTNLMTSMAQSYPGTGERVRQLRDRFRTLAARVHRRGFKKTASLSAGRIKDFVASNIEIFFFEPSSCEVADQPNLQLLPLTLEHLAQAAMVNADDPDTLAYLMRSATRLSKPAYSGYVLHDRDGRGVHFLWVAPYAGFYLSEIDYTIQSSAQDELMIFDCWTPVSERGRRYYSSAIQMLAATLLKQGRSVKIFAAKRNVPSVTGIINAGFEYCFSLVGKRRLGKAIVIRNIRKDLHYPAANCPIRPI